MLPRRPILTVPSKYVSDVDARTMHKYPQVCIEMPCGNNAEYLQLCIVTGDGLQRRNICKFAQQRRTPAAAFPRVAEAVRISAVSVVEWETGPRTGHHCVKRRACVCAISAALNFSLIHATRIAAPPRNVTLYIPVFMPPPRNCPHIFNGLPPCYFDVSFEFPNARKLSVRAVCTYENNNQRSTWSKLSR